MRENRGIEAFKAFREALIINKWEGNRVVLFLREGGTFYHFLKQKKYPVGNN